MSEREHLLDLLAARATEGLSEEDAARLDLAMHGATDIEADGLELAAAAAAVAFDAESPRSETMPAQLKQRILEHSRAHLPSTDTAHAKPAGTPVAPLRRPEAQRAQTGPLSPRYLGWYAAAAMLLVALWAPWSSRVVTPPQTSPPTLAEQRARLLDGAADAIQVAWATPEIAEYARVVGDVVWSDERQAGFMRLKGLPANRSAVEQYQLWIVDPSRDANPIDGGVFDIPAGTDEIIVPIDAKLRAKKPQAFAITLEQPGGVVVSDGPLLVVAPVPGQVS